MAPCRYRSMNTRLHVNRRDFLKAGGVVGAGLMLGNPSLWAQDKEKNGETERPRTNIDEAMKVPRTPLSLPGCLPGKVVEVYDEQAIADGRPVSERVANMFQRGLQELTGKSPADSFNLFFEAGDTVGIKVNPVGAGLISTRLEVVDAVVAWLEDNGIPRGNIVIWDRYDYMLKEAGFTEERYPGIGIEGLQTADEEAIGGEAKDDSRWLDDEGRHVSVGNFDMDVYYWADIEGPKDKPYLNQHVFNGKYSYFGKLLTKKLTKIINVPVCKNTGGGISVAAKNLGYGAVCNTGRLHRGLFFDVCTEVMAFSAIRDKLVMNVADGLVAQYDGGPMPAAQFTYQFKTLFFATDPFALDMICHNIMVEKRKSMKIKVNEHPVFTDYLRYAQRLGLGVVDPERTHHARVDMSA
ncbi:MAG TPA: DUF362 domain-containing protein [Acidobacteriota bacterium]|nr:DUF362 domain-containing protein [Acidobacteriota bacterium]